jgi:hypothetical protein
MRPAVDSTPSCVCENVERCSSPRPLATTITTTTATLPCKNALAQVRWWWLFRQEQNILHSKFNL